MNSVQEAEVLVRRFLRALESRDIDLASSFLASDAKIVLPGSQSFSSLVEIVDWARGRYQWVRKSFERFDSASLGDGTIVVYVMGELHGLNLHDVEFSGVRYIDRFVLRNGLIASQEVWNDLAESGVLETT